MLIEFTVGNFRSIKDPVTLSMLAASLVSKDRALDEENTIQVEDDLRLLTSAAIYGANASGKSNLIAAVRFMRDFILNSSRETQFEDRIKIEKFRLSTETEDQASFFEMVFLMEGKKYRYGFEVTPERVTAEWLFFVPRTREARLFDRKMDSIRVTDQFKEGKGIEERTRPNALFLSVVAQFNGTVSQKVLSWFGQFNINLGIDDMLNPAWARERFHWAKDQQAVIRFVRDLDLGISDIRSEQVPLQLSMAPTTDVTFNEIQEALDRFGRNQEVAKIRTLHPKYDSHGDVVGSEVFDLEAQESAGTRRLFSLALPILDVLHKGDVLFIDEMDARLHPLITCTIIGLFNNKRSNPKNAQLIFTTHDTNLLSNKLFRRDQIWFVEKDRFGATHLYSLAEFKVRNDASFERDYIQGRYGAIPFIQADIPLLVGRPDGEE